jgi:hypothetical protein
MIVVMVHLAKKQARFPEARSHTVRGASDRAAIAIYIVHMIAAVKRVSFISSQCQR